MKNSVNLLAPVAILLALCIGCQKDPISSNELAVNNVAELDQLIAGKTPATDYEITYDLGDLGGIDQLVDDRNDIDFEPENNTMWGAGRVPFPSSTLQTASLTVNDMDWWAAKIGGVSGGKTNVKLRVYAYGKCKQVFYLQLPNNSFIQKIVDPLVNSTMLISIPNVANNSEILLATYQYDDDQMLQEQNKKYRFRFFK